MSDAYQQLSREEFMQQYGVDPDVVMQQQQQATPASKPAHDEGSWGTTALNHLRSGAVGIASIPTDLYAVLPTLYSGGTALYRSYSNDTKFLEEFQKNIQTDEAQANIQKHLDSVAAQWLQRDPNLTDEDIRIGKQNYMKSKAFEDFSMEQLRHFPYVAAKAKDSIRRFLGDERTDDQRGWTESAAEVLGGAIVGGPGGWASGAGSAAAKGGAVLNAAVNNPITRGALKTAEILTPATVPYTGMNVAINATAGLAIDQGLRYAQGKSTAFTPTQEDSAGVGTLAATGLGVAGIAAVVAAVKGRSLQALHQANQVTPSATTAHIEGNPTLNAAIADPARTGEAIIEGGPTPQYGPSSWLDSLPFARRWKNKFEDWFVDQGAAVYRATQAEHGTSVADTLEQSRMNAAYAVMNDSVPAQVSTAMEGVYATLRAMSPREQRSARAAWWLSSDAAQNRIRYYEAMDELNRLQNKISNPQTSPQGKAQAITAHAELSGDIQRFVTDTRSARPRIPDIPMKEGQDMLNVFMNDPSPQMAAFRDQVQKLNRLMLDVEVSSGKLTQAASDEMHRLNPYYVRSMNDPLKNKTGFARLWEGISQGMNNSLERQSTGTGSHALHQSPLRHLDKSIPAVKAAGSPETRITQPLDAVSSATKYVQEAYRDMAITRARNESVLHLAWKDGLGVNQTPTAFHANGGMRVVEAPGGRTWWSGEALHSPELRTAEANPRVVSVWQNGNLQLWEFGDIAIARALRNEPVQMTGLMRGVSISSSIFKSLTTGRFNPAFAPLGAMYNTVIGMLTVKPGRVFGTASYNAKRFLPEWASKALSIFPDITVPLTWPYHFTRVMVELQTYHMTRPVVNYLVHSQAPFAVLQSAVGPKVFNSMVNTMLKVASWAEQSPSAVLHRSGATIGHQTVDNVPHVRNFFDQVKDAVPGPLRAAWQFYKDGLDAIYLADKRMYYTQNMAIESLKARQKPHATYGTMVPPNVREAIINEARTLAGDMAKVPAGRGMVELERALPYLTQTKLGAYHLMRHMGSKDTMAIVIPRVMIMSNLAAASFYMMTYWNKESREVFWDRTPEYQRWKFLYVPTLKLMMSFFEGKPLPYSRDLYYRVPIPPDIAPIVAGMTAFWQMMGAIPADATPKPISGDLFKVLSDSLTPAMPPLAQAGLGMSGLRLDPQSSETRGGDWIRNMVPRFKAGPQAEAATNLGQVTNSTALMTNGLLGALGGHLVAGMDVFLHASKFKPGSGVPTARESADFAAGLRAATGEVTQRIVSRVPDVPLLWQNKERYTTATATWQYMKDNEQHIQAIKGMRNEAVGKASGRRTELATAAGGIAQQRLTDPVLIQIANDINAWQNPTGALGKLKKVYSELGVQQRSVNAQYNLPQGERTKRVNDIVKLMQDNMQQQHLATKYAEQVIAQRYGQALTPRLKGRHLDMSTINAVMRESIAGDSVSSEAPPVQTE
jgi:hypothetical protein